jgi:hypothetical protein
MLFLAPRQAQRQTTLAAERREAMTKPEPTLPSNRAFVVQFRAEATDTQSPYAGRVEHVVSGQTAQFSSSEELWAFMVAVLTHMHPQSGKSSRGENS